jgi:hypothetical protein
MIYHQIVKSVKTEKNSKIYNNETTNKNSTVRKIVFTLRTRYFSKIPNDNDK